MSNNREKVANNNEKLLQLIEKCNGEKSLWARCYHLQHFTAGVDVCARNELIKAHLYKLLMNRCSRIDEIVRTFVKSDCLQPQNGEGSQFPQSEVRKVSLGSLESRPLF